MRKVPGCIPCKLYAGDTPTLTIDSIVICQTHAGYLRTFVQNAPWGKCVLVLCTQVNMMFVMLLLSVHPHWAS
jgi:hypothetical protein